MARLAIMFDNQPPEPNAISGLDLAEQEDRVALAKFDENEPRDEHGRWTTGGGGDALTGGGELIGYSSSAYMDSTGKLHTSNVDDAVRALGEGQKVVLDQPRQLSTLIQRLAEVAKAAKDAGQQAKDYDLCNVSVPGTNLFCADTKGFTRIEMPQLDGKPIAGSRADALPKNQFGEVETTSQFQQFLKDAGFSVDRGTERADYLKATQSELSGVRTAALMGLMQQGKLADSTLFISKDNYIVDGHHRWAAKVGLEFGGGKVLYMNVARVNTDIITLMNEAKSFAHDWGIPQVSKRYTRGTYSLAKDKAGLPYVKFTPERRKRK